MAVAIIEFRKMLEAARRYLAGVGTLAELNGRVRATLEAGHFWRAAAPLMETARDWERMVNRTWNEMGEQGAPLSEIQFSEWLRQQFYFPARDIQ
ncbi:hypothetical protein J4P02_02885 [Pseudomonas sp. NFXW11]|uniref:hypothetical protein n=1 Tax=Pseudomonas sp. NFXW11 TaxID=2819531 RepID=UPI003CE82336